MAIKLIDIVSDTHNQHSSIKLPGGDLFIHSGDMTGRGNPLEILEVMNWIASLPYTYKVVIPGNHDFGFETNFELWRDKFSEKGIHLLNDSGVTIEGIRFWGSPITPWFHDWAYNRHRGGDIARHWALIPEETEVLITHGPPQGILDEVFSYGQSNGGVGCYDLLERILKIPSIKLHIFGHIHEAKGYTLKHGKTFINASSLDRQYRPAKGTPVRVVRDDDGHYNVS